MIFGKRKIFAVLFTAVVLMTVFSTIGLSAETSGDFSYSVSGGEAKITGCSTIMTAEISIPDTLGSFPVTGIGSYAFSSCTELVDIIIPAGVTSIDDDAFSGCNQLTVRCHFSSEAKQYAIKKNIKYELIRKNYDASGDGVVNSVDAVTLKKNLIVGCDISPDGDCNNDSKISVLDLVMLKKHLISYEYRLEMMKANAIPTAPGRFIGNSFFIWPTPNYYSITKAFRNNVMSTHHGIDISGNKINGAPVVAIADGYVKASNSGAAVGNYLAGGGYGNYVLLSHGEHDGKIYKSIYGHMSSITVSEDEIVKQGQVIGYVGMTGNASGYHLHFGILQDGEWVNPVDFYSREQ